MKKNPKPAKFRPRKAQRQREANRKRSKAIKGSQSHKQDPRQHSRKNNRLSTKVAGKQKTSQFVPKLTHSEQNKLDKAKRKEQSLMAKLIIKEELKQSSPNFEKIKEYLSKIISRGTKQRLRDQATRLQKQRTSNSE